MRTRAPESSDEVIEPGEDARAAFGALGCQALDCAFGAIIVRDGARLYRFRKISAVLLKVRREAIDELEFSETEYLIGPVSPR